LRYGSGWLVRKTRETAAGLLEGPSWASISAATLSKMLHPGLRPARDRRLFQRFPGVDGSFYVVAGLGINYFAQRRRDLAPMRTGVGLRAASTRIIRFIPTSADWFPALGGWLLPPLSHIAAAHRRHVHSSIDAT